MLPFQIVESATFFPNGCVCGASIGPFVDSGIERADVRVYLCTRCVKSVVTLFEFVPAADHDVTVTSLDAAARQVTSLGGELDTVRRERDRLEKDLERLKGTVAELQAERGAERDALQRFAEENKALRAGSAPLADLHAALAGIQKAAASPPPKRAAGKA